MTGRMKWVHVARYVAHGSVCGTCDHKHLSAVTAQACADKHHSDIQRANGNNSYSDRQVHLSTCPAIQRCELRLCDCPPFDYDVY